METANQNKDHKILLSGIALTSTDLCSFCFNSGYRFHLFPDCTAAGILLPDSPENKKNSDYHFLFIGMLNVFIRRTVGRHFFYCRHVITRILSGRIC